MIGTMERFRTSDEAVDLAFDESQQAEIIACAAALQRQEGLTATLSDLERAALEAGIEPRFIREAVRLQGAKPETVEVAAGESSWPIWRAVILAVILVPAELFAIAWAHDTLSSLWGSFVIAALFGLGLPRRSFARWIAVAWPIFVTVTIVVFDNTARFQGKWAVDALLAAIQGAVAFGVLMLASARHHGGVSRAFARKAGSIGRKIAVPDKIGWIVLIG